MQEHICAELVPIFNHLDRASLVKISGITQYRHFRRGETIFSPGQGGGLLILAQGRVKVYQLSSAGKEQLLRVLAAGDFIGEETLFGSGESDSFGEALTDLEACTISREDFIALLTEYPAISLKLLEEYSRRLTAADRLATRTATEPVSARLAAYLLELEKAADGGSLTLPLSMKELATFLGTTPETLSRRMRRFEMEGLLKRDGKHIKLLRPDVLAVARFEYPAETGNKKSAP